MDWRRRWLSLALVVLAACGGGNAGLDAGGLGMDVPGGTDPRCDRRFYSEGLRLTPPEWCAVKAVALSGDACGDTFDGGQGASFVWVMAAKEGTCAVTVTFKDDSVWTTQTTFSRVADELCGDYLKGSGHQKIPESACPGCRFSNECPTGQYCQIKYPAGTCSNPERVDPGTTACGPCTTPGTGIVKCVGGEPYSGDRCDPSELPAGYVCRTWDCNTECARTCSCADGTWDCSISCWDYLPRGDAGAPFCGTPPVCWNSCWSRPPPGADAGL